MSDARNAILARLRQGQAQQAKPAEVPLRSPSQVSLEVFCEHLRNAHAQVIHCRPSDWLSTVVQRLASRGGSLACGRSAEGQQLHQAAVEQGLDVCWYDEQLDKQQLFNQVDVGFSVAQAGLAATGSLVVETGPDEPRMLSLVPPLSIVLLRRSTLLADFNAYVQHRGDVAMPTNLLLISGPSKTADIQQTLAYGAHGPKELWVLLVNDVEEPA
jgi:L-lactate dehydrogenase complex protein LldG